jgi:uncharacterized damage-inducible protein DinB
MGRTVDGVMNSVRGAMFGLALLILAVPVHGQGLTEAILGDLADVQGKTLALAEAMPEAAFDWRPGEGVRSFGEVLMHLTGANYGILYRIGAVIPDSVPAEWYQDPESVVGKETVIQALRTSSTWARSVVEETPVNTYGGPAPNAGPETSVLSQLLLLQNHGHEHLGQLIAYARMNDVIPPWSR